MSIRDRIEDAEFLWQHGRKEGAFLSVLSAISATARLRYPDRQTISDGESFRQFLQSCSRMRTKVEFRGELYTLEQIFYKWFRCELVHEAGLPVDIQFIQTDDPNQLSLRAGGNPEYVLKLSEGWFNFLLGAVINAPENQDYFRRI